MDQYPEDTQIRTGLLLSMKKIVYIRKNFMSNFGTASRMMLLKGDFSNNGHGMNGDLR